MIKLNKIKFFILPIIALAIDFSFSQKSFSDSKKPVLDESICCEYKGKLKNGLADGFGESKGKECTYKGYFKNGFRDGNGIKTCEDHTSGGKYICEGQFSNNLISLGKCTYGNGEEIKFVNNKIESRSFSSLFKVGQSIFIEFPVMLDHNELVGTKLLLKSTILSKNEKNVTLRYIDCVPIIFGKVKKMGTLNDISEKNSLSALMQCDKMRGKSDEFFSNEIIALMSKAKNQTGCTEKQQLEGKCKYNF